MAEMIASSIDWLVMNINQNTFYAKNLLKGKVALVTGSTSGIGLGIVRHLAAKGCDVIVTGLGEELEINEILRDLRNSYKADFHFVAGDLSCQESTLGLCKGVEALYPEGVDILINNAGILEVLPIEEYSLDKFNAMVAVNMTAPFIITQHFVPFMKKKGWGRIVNTSSIMGLVSQKGKVPYSTTKTGLIGMTKGVALEVAEFGITCNAICPALVDTEMLQKQIKDKAISRGISYEEMRKKHFDEIAPTKKPVSVEQLTLIWISKVYIDRVIYLGYLKTDLPIYTVVLDVRFGYYTRQGYHIVSMEGKVAFVTGSTSGIGLGIARCLAAKGCDVILTGFGSPEAIDIVLADLRSKYKGRFMHVDGDLSKEESTLDMCNAVTAAYPDGVDILINNAGIQHVCKIEEYPMAKFNEMVAINLTAPFIITRHFVSYMKKKGWGRIVNTASQMGLISAPGKIPYSATKAGLIGMTKGTALEVATFGVTCNAICPGFVETQLLTTQFEQLAVEQSTTFEDVKEKFFKERHPSQQPISIEQVASFVGYLCSNEAACINGAALSIDAGYTAK